MLPIWLRTVFSLIASDRAISLGIMPLAIRSNTSISRSLTSCTAFTSSLATYILSIYSIYTHLPFKTSSNVLIAVKTSAHRTEIHSVCGPSRARNLKIVPDFLHYTSFMRKGGSFNHPFFCNTAEYTTCSHALSTPQQKDVSPFI